MTTAQLNAEIYRSLSTIAEEESLMKKAAKYLGRLAAEKRKEDETKMSKEDYFAKIEHSIQQAESGECVCFDNQDAMNAWLKKL